MAIGHFDPSQTHRVHVTKPIAKKFVAGDYVHNFYSCAKFGGNTLMGASGQISKIKPKVFIYIPF